MLVCPINCSNRDAFQLSIDFFLALSLNSHELLKSRQKCILSDHFVSDVELNNRTSFKVLHCSEETWPYLKRVYCLTAGWIHKVTSCSHSFELHHLHDLVEDNLEKLVDLWVVTWYCFSPCKLDLVELSVVLYFKVECIILEHVRRVDAITKVQVGFKLLSNLITNARDKFSAKLRVVRKFWDKLDSILVDAAALATDSELEVIVVAQQRDSLAMVSFARLCW